MYSNISLHTGCIFNSYLNIVINDMTSEQDGCHKWKHGSTLFSYETRKWPRREQLKLTLDFE